MDNLYDKERQISSIKNGKGMQYILNEAYQILGHPIITLDMDYKAIAYTEDIVTDDPIWSEYAANGTIGSNWQEFLKNEGFLYLAANTDKTALLSSSKLKYDRTYGKVFNKDNIQVGCACMVACEKPFEVGDYKLFEAVCDICSKELSEIEFYQSYGQAYQETLINQLIEGNVKDRKLYTAHVESIYMHLKANLYLAVVDIGQYGSELTKLTYFRDLFKKTQPEYKYSIYSGNIAIIISSDSAELNAARDLDKLYGFFEQNNIYAGISSCFDNLFELRRYYIEASEALNRGVKGDKNNRIFLYGVTSS